MPLPTKEDIGRASGARLVLHLAVVLVIKLLLLGLIWWLFIHPYRVHVDEHGMERRLVGQSDPNVVLKEKDHD